MVRFWDTSAIVPLTIDEAQTPTLRSVFEEDKDLVVWWSTRVEMASALSRSSRERSLPTEALRNANAVVKVLSEAWAEVVPSDGVRSRAIGLLLTHDLRAADALQLAAALVWAGDDPADCVFVSADKKLRVAASTVGFRVLPVEPSAASRFELAP